MIIGHASDLHVSLGRTGFGGIDALEAAGSAIRYFEALANPPDLVVLTGDLADSAQGYLAVRDAFAATGIPFLACVGNHDDRESFAATLGYDRDADGFVQYTVDDYELRVVALDSKRDDHGDGLLCDRRLDWLEAALGTAPERQTVVLLHHPPIRTGLWWPDGPGLGGTTRLERILRAHPEVVAVLCGHVHSAASAQWAGTLVQIAPATCWTAALDIGEELPFRALVERPRVMLHAFVDGTLVSHVATVTSEPRSEVSLMGGWANMRSFMRDLQKQRRREEAARETP